MVSLFASVIAIGLSVFSETSVSYLILAFGVVAIIGTCCTYVKSVNLRKTNSKLMEIYRKMLMCFETVEEMAKEQRNRTDEEARDRASF